MLSTLVFSCTILSCFEEKEEEEGKQEENDGVCPDMSCRDTLTAIYNNSSVV